MSMRHYVISGGHSGRERLKVLSSALRSGTDALLRRARVDEARRILDVGCGGGDVTVLLAELAPTAEVLGIDVDPVVVDIASSEARHRGLTNVSYTTGDITTAELPRHGFDVVYARFVLCHVAHPERVLDRMCTWVAPGGTVIIEDVGIPGGVCAPDSHAYTRVNDLVSEAMRLRHGDPELGRRLPLLMRDAGLAEIDTVVVQPGALQGDAKRLQLLTLDTTADTLIELGLTSRDETDQLRHELSAFVERSDTYVTTARIFQCVGRRHRAATQPTATSTTRTQRDPR